jgi:hypothetical protein
MTIGRRLSVLEALASPATLRFLSWGLTDADIDLIATDLGLPRDATIDRLRTIDAAVLRAHQTMSRGKWSAQAIRTALGAYLDEPIDGEAAEGLIRSMENDGARIVWDSVVG